MPEVKFQHFTPLNQAYNTVFRPQKLSIGLVRTH